MISALAAAATGRRGRWLTIGIWIAIGAGGWVARSHIAGITAAGQASFLPKHSEAIRAQEALQGRRGGRGAGSGGGAQQVPAVIVFDREGGLTHSDLRAIGHLGVGLNELKVTGATPVIDPFTADSSESLGDVAKNVRGVGPLSRDGEAALVVLAINSTDRGAVEHGVAEIRAYLASHAIPGVRAYVTGPAGIAADLDRLAGEAGKTLLIATVSLVLVLLLVVYRAPVLAVLPLLAVGVAYMVAIGIAYLLIKAGWITVNTEGTFLVLVLVFGAGTDYSLLLVHRYREELQRGRLPPEALSLAVRESAPALAASAGTVIAAMLVLLVAELESTHWLGPILAIGVAVMLLSALTLLPALLSVLGERAFWLAEAATDRPAPNRAWQQIAGFVRRRSLALVLLVPACLLVLALGNFAHHGTIGFGQGQTRQTNSSRGTAVLNNHFPPGLASPLFAVVEPRATQRVVAGMASLASVRLALPVPPRHQGEEAVVVVILAGDPYSGEAAAQVKAIGERLHAISPSGLLGGIPAENYEIEQTNARDTRLILPLVLRCRRPHPRRRAAGAGRAGVPDRDRRPFLRRDARALHLRLLAACERRACLQPRPPRLPLPGGARRGLQHLPNDPGPAGDGYTRHARGYDRRPCQHRRCRHRRRPDPRGHLRHPHPVAPRGADSGRRRRRRRGPDRYVRRPSPADPGDRLPARRTHLVAVAPGPLSRRALPRRRPVTTTPF